MPLFEERSDSEAVAYVRYVEFSDRSERGTLFSSPKLQRKSVSGPSGHQYTFRQKGRPTNEKSQWLPVRGEDDAEAFSEADGFEVRRDRP